MLIQAISRGEGAPSQVPRPDLDPVQRLARPQGALDPDRARRGLHPKVSDKRTGTEKQGGHITSLE